MCGAIDAHGAKERNIKELEEEERFLKTPGIELETPSKLKENTRALTTVPVYLSQLTQ